MLASIALTLLCSFTIAGAQRPPEEGGSFFENLVRALTPDALADAPDWARRAYALLFETERARQEAPAPVVEPEGARVVPDAQPERTARRAREAIEESDPYAVGAGQQAPVAAAPARMRPAVDTQDPYGEPSAERSASSANAQAVQSEPRARLVLRIESDDPYL